MALNVSNSDGIGRRFHYLYEVQFGEKRILRPESMTFVIGRSKAADLVIDAGKVARKQCEVICSGESWKLRNLSPKGTPITGRGVVRDTVMDIQCNDIMKIGGIFLQFKYKVEEEEYPRRVLTLIGLIGEKFCSLAAETVTLSDVHPRQEEPEGAGKAVVAYQMEDEDAEAVERSKDETIKNLTADNNQLLQELAEAKSALRKALTDKGEAELRDAETKEQMKSIQEMSQISQTVGDVIEAELQCSVCNDLLINAVTLSCSHTFCEYCLEQWKKKNKICPLCRSKILQECQSRVIDAFIEKILVHLPEDIQNRRKEIMDSRKAPKKRSKKSSSGRSKRKRISVIELGTPGEDMNEIVRLSFDFSDPQNETIEIISSDDEVYL